MRAVFLVFAHRLADVPPSVQRVLRQIPPAALASIVALELLRPRDELDLWQPELAAGVVAALGVLADAQHRAHPRGGDGRVDRTPPAVS